MDMHTLLWRVPAVKKPAPRLPPGVERTFIATPGGQLELLVALPSQPATKPPLLFVHGGFGSAQCYRNYLPYFSARGYAAYAVSLRGHGESWQPGFWRMYFLARQRMVEDVAWAARHVRQRQGRAVVLAGHSSGGGCAQDLVSQGLEPVAGLVLLASIPGSGSLEVNLNWWRLDPWCMVRLLQHFGHPRSPLSSTALVKGAFFSPAFPDAQVREVEARMAEWESMRWAVGMLWRFVDPRKVARGAARMLVLAAEEDQLMGVRIELELARWYRAHGGVVEDAVVLRAGHHFMLDSMWEDGARVIEDWLERGP